MNLGMLTAGLPERSVDQIATFAAASEFECLEVAVGLKVGGRKYEASYLLPAKRNEYGVFGKADKGGNSREMDWWRFRVPGRGIVDWPCVVGRLYEAGFDGTLSVEHADPLWGGTDENITEGLRIAQKTLRPLIVHKLTTAEGTY